MGHYNADDESIYTYTRADALSDGVLIDVSETARETGFAVPVALTAALWADIEAIPARYQSIQDVQGRLWDVLWMGSLAARSRPSERGPIIYQLIMRVEGSRRNYYEAKMIMGPGDAGEPVLTLMRPDEN